ncbi:MAG: phosphohydrolase, partial [bacterium]
MRDAVRELWPELEWIEDRALREATAKTWETALARSPLTPRDLREIPFTLLVPGLDVTFMEHKRAVVHIARRSAEAMAEFFGKKLPI